MIKLICIILLLPTISLAKCFVVNNGGRIESVNAKGFVPEQALQECPKDNDGKHVLHSDDLKVVQVEDENGELKNEYQFDEVKRQTRLDSEASKKDEKEADKTKKDKLLKDIKNGCKDLSGTLKDMCEYISGK